MNELNIKDLLKTVAKHWKLITVIVFLAIAIASVYYFTAVPDEFTSTTTLYVLNQQSEENVTYSDLTGSALLIKDYRELISSYKVQSKVAEILGLPDLSEYQISVQAINDTRFISISVTGKQAYMTANIAGELAKIFSETVVDIMRVDNVSIIDEARVPISPSGPARARNIVLAAVIALALSILGTVILECLNTTIKTTQDIEKQLGIPVLARMSFFKEKEAQGGKKQ